MSDSSTPNPPNRRDDDCDPRLSSEVFTAGIDVDPNAGNTSHEYRCIFIHIPKVAGTSIKQALDMPGRGHLPWQHYARHHPELWRQYTSFTVVRNPWDRTVSAYRFAKMKTSYWHDAKVGPPIDYKLLREKSFEECLAILDTQRDSLQGEQWYPQTAWVAKPHRDGGQLMVDRVLRFENLDHDFGKLCKELGVAEKTLLKINRSKRSRDYRQYYNDETRAIVERAYAADIEAFGYSF